MAQARVYAEPSFIDELQPLGFRWCNKDQRFEKNGKLDSAKRESIEKLQQKHPQIRFEQT